MRIKRRGRAGDKGREINSLSSMGVRIHRMMQASQPSWPTKGRQKGQTTTSFPFQQTQILLFGENLRTDNFFCFWIQTHIRSKTFCLVCLSVYFGNFAFKNRVLIGGRRSDFR